MTDTVYKMRAGGFTLTAYDIKELAELAECAVEAGDTIDSIPALGGRHLQDRTLLGVRSAALALTAGRPSPVGIRAAV